MQMKRKGEKVASNHRRNLNEESFSAAVA